MDRSILKSMIETIKVSDQNGILGTDGRLKRHINRLYLLNGGTGKLVELTILADLLDLIRKSNESRSGCDESADDRGECDD